MVMVVVIEFSVMRCQPLRRALYLLREIRWNFKESWKI
ncbi:acetyltransferase [Vibrio cholerae]|nr:acetyltransferase [Vibrio cholerae]KAA1195986.1 acetyltransferase [Vibrio cholerae]KAA1201330.1 acetyltransferase [Vibrio cholerae]TYW32401.1 acetyltransferase [Vibrio cholerae]TYW39959.1 acetyltransferase [Vibrio cholerae]